MSARSLVYPTAERLRTLQKGDHGIPAERLTRCYRVESNGCWRWTGSIASNGYGHFSIHKVYYQAHLLVYILKVGPLPEGLEPDHRCRNRWCVRPGCIEFVTHAVNVQRGIRSILTPEQVDEIRTLVRAGASQRALAPLYGIDHSTISRLVRGLIWADRPFPVEVAA